MNIKCIRCKEEKDSSCFSKNRRSKTGHCLYCKPCAKEMSLIKLATIEYVSVEEEKRCLHCQVIKPISEFSKNRRRKTGVVNVCKSCVNNKAMARYREIQESKIIEHYSNIFNNWDYTTDRVGVCKIPIFKYKKGDFLYREPFNYAIIDCKDLCKVKNFIFITTGGGYAILSISRTNNLLSNNIIKDIKKKTLRLHEIVLGNINEEGLLEPYYTSIHSVVDHINGDILDNTSANLRKCTNTENSYNRTKAGGLVPYVGVIAQRSKNKKSPSDVHWYFCAYFSGRKLFKEKATSEDTVYKIVAMRESWNVLVNGDFAPRQILTKESRDKWLTLHVKNMDWKEARDFVKNFYADEEYASHIDKDKKHDLNHLTSLFGEDY